MHLVGLAERPNWCHEIFQVLVHQVKSCIDLDLVSGVINRIFCFLLSHRVGGQAEDTYCPGAYYHTCPADQAADHMLEDSSKLPKNQNPKTCQVELGTILMTVGLANSGLVP